MIRTFIEEFLFPIIVFLVLRFLLRGWIGGSRRQPIARRPAPPPPSGAELKKDPVCGIYVSPSNGFSRMIDGQLVCFCSKECRDRFAASH